MRVEGRGLRVSSLGLKFRLKVQGFTPNMGTCSPQRSNIGAGIIATSIPLWSLQNYRPPKPHSFFFEAPKLLAQNARP